MERRIFKGNAVKYIVKSSWWTTSQSRKIVTLLKIQLLDN